MYITINRKIDLGKKAFDLIIETNGDEEAFKELAFIEEITRGVLKSCLRYFISRDFSPKPSPEDLKKFREINFFKSKKVHKLDMEAASLDFNVELTPYPYDEACILEILSLDTLSELLDWVINGTRSYNEIMNDINLYLANPANEVSNHQKIIYIREKLLLEEIRHKISTEKAIIEEKSQSNENASLKGIAANIITELLVNETVNLEALLSEFQISKSVFNQSLISMENGSAEEQILYRSYLKREEEELKKAENTYKLIEYYLNNKISKNGKLASFTILDFYRISDITPRNLLSKLNILCKNGVIKRRKYEEIASFFDLNSSRHQVLSEEDLLQKISYKINGANVDYDVTQRIINYLKSIAAPITLINYLYALAEYNAGLLDLDPLTLV